MPNATVDDFGIQVTEDGLEADGAVGGAVTVNMRNPYPGTLLASDGGHFTAVKNQAPASPWLLATFTVNNPSAMARPICGQR